MHAANCLLYRSAVDALQRSLPCAQEVVATNFCKEMRFTFSQYRTMYCVFTFFAVMMVRPFVPYCKSFVFFLKPQPLHSNEVADSVHALVCLTNLLVPGMA